MHVRSNSFRVWVVLLAACCGCATWSPQPERAETELPKPRMSPDSVVLQVAFVRLPADDGDLNQELWREVDEHVLPVDMQQRLSANGVRVGLVGSPLPDLVRELLDQAEESPLETGPAAYSLQDVTSRAHRRHLRPGKPGKIVLRNAERLSVLTVDDDHQVRGESFAQAQCLLVTRSFPESEGSVRFELVPTVEYGEPLTRYVGRQGAWTLDTSRQSRTFGGLRIEAQVGEGQTLMLSSTTDLRGLGQQFFTIQTDSGPQRYVLLIRLQQTQHDGRFETTDDLDEVLEELGS